MLRFARESVVAALNGDFEFRHAARYWDASIRLGIGEQALCVRIARGLVEEVRPWSPDDRIDVGIDASESEWRQLLAPVPRPFYQSLFAAAVHHDVALSGDPLDSYAYLGALTRMLEVMRDHANLS